MIDYKTPEQISDMRDGGKKLGTILQKLLDMASPGVLLTDIDRRAGELISESGAQPSFSTVKGYHWPTCLCVNDVVVHGIPTGYALKAGDVLTIDIGLIHKGFHTDTAWTKIIQEVGNEGQETGEKQKFLATGQLALERAIGQARVGNRVGNISKIVQDTIEEAGYSLVKSLVGHGVGRQLHEDPQVPNFLRGDITQTPELKEGMTIAIEPIYAMGRGDIEYVNDDGWTLGTKDQSLTAVFEHSIAITANGPIVLTKP